MEPNDPPSQGGASAHRYGARFFEHAGPGSRASARHVVPVLAAALPIRSVLDVGCGRGMWLAEWTRAGAEEVFGVDGAPAEPDELAIPATAFRTLDLAVPFDLGRRFELVQCLEVGEHIPRERSPTLINNLIRHGKLVLFSAATPGQIGEHHVNEQPFGFWRALFAERGYHPYDFVRPRIASRRVMPWYRYNILLYAHADAAAALPSGIAATRVADGVEIARVESAYWRVRAAIFRRVSPAAMTRIAVLRRNVELAWRRNSPKAE
jgi:SAM-dependent methyltransferase